jgi:hypothetical protein
MELQGELGDRAGAVSTYHHCASVLERELGVALDPATRTALNRLLAQLEPAQLDPIPRPAPEPEPVADRSGLAGAQLIGRSVELDRLRAVWRRAAAGRPSLVLIRPPERPRPAPAC